MAQLPAPFPFPLGGPPPDTDAEGCWIGTPTLLELFILTPLIDPDLERLRSTMVTKTVTGTDLVKGGRVVLQMAYETEIGVILHKLAQPSPTALVSKVCQRRHFLDIDADMRLQTFIIEPALAALQNMPSPVPQVYAEFLRRYLASNYARYRVCALAVMVLLAVILSRQGT